MSDPTNQQRDEVMDWAAFAALALFMAWMMAQCATP